MDAEDDVRGSWRGASLGSRGSLFWVDGGGACACSDIGERVLGLPPPHRVCLVCMMSWAATHTHDQHCS